MSDIREYTVEMYKLVVTDKLKERGFSENLIEEWVSNIE
jgi:hypothetical protein